jgi:hypothetical protein
MHGRAHAAAMQRVLPEAAGRGPDAASPSMVVSHSRHRKRSARTPAAPPASGKGSGLYVHGGAPRQGAAARGAARWRHQPASKTVPRARPGQRLRRRHRADSKQGRPRRRACAQIRKRTAVGQPSHSKPVHANTAPCTAAAHTAPLRPIQRRCGPYSAAAAQQHCPGQSPPQATPGTAGVGAAHNSLRCGKGGRGNHTPFACCVTRCTLKKLRCRYRL